MTTETSHLFRVERKVDDLTEAVRKLILFEERQTVQGLAIAAITVRVEAAERKLDMWINRGVGVWAFASSSFALWKMFGHSIL